MTKFGKFAACAGLLIGGLALGALTATSPSWSAYFGAVKLLDSAGTNQAAVDSSGRVAIQAPPTLPLPTGATTPGCAGQSVANTSTVSFDNNGTSTSIKLVSKVSGQKVYICGIKVGPAAAAINIAIVEGTKTTTECDTGAKGLFNGATAARGDQIAANGGYVYGNGIGVVAITPDANNDVCVLFSTTSQIGGTITWAQF